MAQSLPTDENGRVDLSKMVFDGDEFDGTRTQGPQENVVALSATNERLDKRFDLRKHSPTGFEWGYSGSGPHQLALAMLACVYDDETALEHYREFTREVIATIEADDWSLDVGSVKNWVRSKENNE